MPRFSANLGFLWAELPLLERIDRAAAMGFRAVELHWPYDTPADEVRAACARHGLALLGINTPVGERAGDFGLAAQPGREDEFMAGAQRALDYCRAAGGTSVHVMAGVVPGELREQATETLLRNLRTLAAKAEDLTLLLEPINHVDKPGYFYSRPAEACRIIDEVGTGNVRLMFDFYHAAHAEDDVLASLAESYDHIGHVQVAGYPSRQEPDEGVLDWEPALRWLDERGYEGWVGAEYRPRAAVEEGLAWKTRWETG